MQRDSKYGTDQFLIDSRMDSGEDQKIGERRKMRPA